MSVEYALGNCPLILGNIFKFLNARDLNICTQVCSFWHSNAEFEKRKRPKEITTFFKVGPCDDHNSTCFTSDQCEVTNNNRMEVSLYDDLCYLRTQPAFCISFISLSLYEKCRSFFPSLNTHEPNKKKLKPSDEITKRKYLRSVVGTVLKPHLPANCPVVFCVAPGVIGSNKNFIPIEIEDAPAITGAFFPKQPGVDIQHFAVRNQKSNLSDFVTNGSDVKCLLIFFTERGIGSARTFIKSCQAIDVEQKVAVGGAIVEHTESLLGTVVAFFGPNVEAASVIVKSENNKRELTAKLELFQKTGLLKNQCFAFMFACVARGFQRYRKYNLESNVFHKMYPSVPLFGVFGNGEIGVNYTPNAEVDSQKSKGGRRAKKDQQYFYVYTTVFVLIAIKS